VQSIQDRVAEIKRLQAELASLDQSSFESADAYQAAVAQYEADINGYMGAVEMGLADLGDADVDAIAERIMNLMTALASGDLDDSEIADYTDELQGLLDLVTLAGSGEFGQTGTNIVEGIAQGMNTYGWSGDAASLATSITDAINGALGAHSPATKLIPTGSDVAEGIAKGMETYSFAAAAASVSSGITGAFSGLPARGRTIGAQFGQGLYNGLQGRMSAVLALARQYAAQITTTFQSAWQIHSPSRVAENLTDMFGRGLEKGMEGWPTVSERLLQDDLDALYSGARRATDAGSQTNTYNNNNSVNMTVENMEVKSETDAATLAAEINAINQRKARARGLSA